MNMKAKLFNYGSSLRTDGQHDNKPKDAKQRLGGGRLKGGVVKNDQDDPTWDPATSSFTGPSAWWRMLCAELPSRKSQNQIQSESYSAPRTGQSAASNQ
jgi:hypothetical protein